MKSFEEQVLLQIYKRAIAEDKVFMKRQSKNDRALVKDCLREIKRLGYPYDSLVDFHYRKIEDQRLVGIAVKYLKRFDNTLLNHYLFDILTIRGSKEAAAAVIDFYEYVKREDIAGASDFFSSVDNALWKIKDKSQIETYRKWFNDPVDFTNLPATMEMLTRWDKNSSYLRDKLIYYLQPEALEVKGISTRGMAFYLIGIAKNEAFIEYIEPFLSSDDENVRRVARKVLDKIEKQALKRKQVKT